MHGLLKSDKTAFVFIDIQEKFMPAIHEPDVLLANSKILMDGAEILGVPIVVTEQYPTGLGKTVIEYPERARKIEKICFSCFDSDDFLDAVKGLKSLVLIGIEAHVCVLKTALEGLKNHDVHVVEDAVSSRAEANKRIALERMRQSGVYIVSTEMVLFQMLERAGTDQFKAISKLIK